MRTSGSFEPLEFTELVRRSPRKASAELSNHYAAHRIATSVAAELGVGVRTLKRWLALLRDAGHPIRESVRARRGWALGRKRGPRITAKSRTGKKKLPIR